MKMQMTIEEIASEAGVSKSTVSRVLNGRPDVLPATRDLVMSVVDKYNYQPNAWAKGMSQKSVKNIGLVIPHDIDYIFKNPYYSEVQRGVLKAAKNRGYYLLVMCCRDLKEAEDAAMQKRIDGLVVLSPTQGHKETLERFQNLGMPFVTIGKATFVAGAHQLCTDNYRGATLIMDHLTALGHEKIGFISGPYYLPSSEERYNAYVDGMKKLGNPTPEALILEGENSISSGAACINQLLDAQPDLTAVFVGSDHMAVGVLDAIRQRGLRVPQDISVIGFDNIPLGQYTAPQLSTVDQHIEKKGFMAAEMLLDLIEGIEPDQRIIDLEAELLIRESTAAPPVKK